METLNIRTYYRSYEYPYIMRGVDHLFQRILYAHWVNGWNVSVELITGDEVPLYSYMQHRSAMRALHLDIETLRLDVGDRYIDTISDPSISGWFHDTR